MIGGAEEWTPTGETSKRSPTIADPEGGAPLISKKMPIVTKTDPKKLRTHIAPYVEHGKVCGAENVGAIAEQPSQDRLIGGVEEGTPTGEPSKRSPTIADLEGGSANKQKRTNTSRRRNACPSPTAARANQEATNGKQK